jgi:hypothetical protein
MSVIAFIYTIDGWPIGECKTIDISEGGAKIMWSSSEEVPIEFFLSLSKDGKVRRHCQLKWRAGNEIGIRFTLKGFRQGSASIFCLTLQPMDVFRGILE